ncbi:hypothetical protein Csa_018103 [Cucumis sativus]|nr:hypothetical protein Csa_018103 [Cucumis sativus]
MENYIKNPMRQLSLVVSSKRHSLLRPERLATSLPHHVSLCRPFSVLSLAIKTT